jgi:predicted transposase YbfD/YdcC
MDPGQYTNLLQALAHVADPRKARGKQHEWRIVLAVLCAAVASGQRSVRAIAQWAKEHETELIQHLQPTRQRLPSAATLYRVMRGVDVASVENHLACFSSSQERKHNAQAARQARQAKHKLGVRGRGRDKRDKKRKRFVGQAVDGKELRGARAHGRPICLVSLVRHGTGCVLAQRAVDQKSNEITAVPHLLGGRNLRGTVTTMDALLTQRAIAKQIVGGGGHYLMGIKANQPELYLATQQLFASPPWLAHEQQANYRCYSKVEKGHGRLEKRTLESSGALREYLRMDLLWPGGEQVLRRTCRRVMLSSGEISEEVKYGITSLKWEEADASELERLWRGHWTIENRVHHVRDVTMGEDANQMRVGNAPQVLAAVRNAVLNLLRCKGWTNIADGLRHYGAFVHRALALVTSP